MSIYAICVCVIVIYIFYCHLKFGKGQETSINEHRIVIYVTIAWNKSHKIKHKFWQKEINWFWKRIQLKFPIFLLFPCCNPITRENLRQMAWLRDKVWYQVWLNLQFSLKCTMILTPMLTGQNVVSQILDFLSHNTTNSIP